MIDINKKKINPFESLSPDSHSGRTAGRSSSKVINKVGGKKLKSHCPTLH